MRPKRDRLLEALPPSANLAMAYSARSLLAVNRGWDQETLEFGRRALALAREFDDTQRNRTHCATLAQRCLVPAITPGTIRSNRVSLWRSSTRLKSTPPVLSQMLFYAVLIHDFAEPNVYFARALPIVKKEDFSHSATCVPTTYLTSSIEAIDRGRAHGE